jgi:hypothetical protein
VQARELDNIDDRGRSAAPLVSARIVRLHPSAIGVPSNKRRYGFNQPRQDWLFGIANMCVYYASPCPVELEVLQLRLRKYPSIGAPATLSRHVVRARVLFASAPVRHFGVTSNGALMRLGEIGDNFSVHITQFIAEGDTVVWPSAPTPATARAPASPPK